MNIWTVRSPLQTTGTETIYLKSQNTLDTLIRDIPTIKTRYILYCHEIFDSQSTSLVVGPVIAIGANVASFLDGRIHEVGAMHDIWLRRRFERNVVAGDNVNVFLVDNQAVQPGHQSLDSIDSLDEREEAIFHVLLMSLARMGRSDLVRWRNCYKATVLTITELV